MDSEDNGRKYYTFYYNDGTTRIFNLTRIEMNNKMNESQNVEFVLHGIELSRYVWVAGLWTPRTKKEKPENE
jgi:hypothetical protein